MATPIGAERQHTKHASWAPCCPGPIAKWSCFGSPGIREGRDADGGRTEAAPRQCFCYDAHQVYTCPQAMKGVTRMLGARVWDYSLIGLTHGRVLPPTLDQSYGDAHLLGILPIALVC